MPPGLAHPSRLRELLTGCRDELPILLGVVPFGMIYGILALDAGLSPVAAQSMSSIVFAGSAQLVTAQLWREAVPGAVIVLTVFVVNLRHALYSASLAPYLKDLDPAWKGILAYLLTDEAYAVAVTRYVRDEDRPDAAPFRHWYLLGAGFTLWLSWQLSTAAGVFMGGVVPRSWSLEFTLPLTFIALVFPGLKDRGAISAAVAAGLLAVLAAGLPFKLGLIAAAIAGILVGLVVEANA